MPVILVWFLAFFASGILWRILASIGFGLATAFYINGVIDDYLTRSLTQFNTALHPDISALLGIVRADDCISIIIGGILFVATYKSLKLIFVRKL